MSRELSIGMHQERASGISRELSANMHPELSNNMSREFSSAIMIMQINNCQ